MLIEDRIAYSNYSKSIFFDSSKLDLDKRFYSRDFRL